MKDRAAGCRLELNNVSHRFKNIPVIEDLTMIARSNEILVMVGPSGCGKTTILNMLSGHLKPSSGALIKNGTTRMVYQQDGLFPWLTVNENIGMGLQTVDAAEREQSIMELIELIHLQGFENHYPHQLSGGMRQRVELARVLAGESDILLMDEPFSALDYQTRLRMRRELIDLLAKRPKTVVFVTHDIEEAVQLADRVLVLSKRPTYICRELILDAPHPRVSTSPAIIEAMNVILTELGLNSSINQYENV
jgi:NitT/TauT family transport system ATP-binding protein